MNAAQRGTQNRVQTFRPLPLGTVQRARRLLNEDGVPLAEVVVRREVDLLFRGQSHAFRVPVTAPGFDPDTVLVVFIERRLSR